MTQRKEQQLQTLMAELIDAGNSDVITERFATDYTAHAGAKAYHGHSFLKRFAKQLRTAMPDIRTVDVTFLAREGDTVVWQRTLSGTHQATMQRIPASGKKLTWVEMVVTRFADEKIAEEWVVSELMGQMLLHAGRK